MNNLSPLKKVPFALLTASLLLVGYACKKKNKLEEIDYEYTRTEVICYPDNQQALTFEIAPTNDIGPYSINWLNPTSLSGNGPYQLLLSSNMTLAFEIHDESNRIENFQHLLTTDEHDSLLNDYRNHCIGVYVCDVTYEDGTVVTNGDTLTVIKDDAFKRVIILKSADVANNNPGNTMNYLSVENHFHLPRIDFYGYHSGARFSDGHIFYSFSGPMGSFSTIEYNGVKM